MAPDILAAVCPARNDDVRAEVEKGTQTPGENASADAARAANAARPRQVGIRVGHDTSGRTWSASPYMYTPRTGVFHVLERKNKTEASDDGRHHNNGGTLSVVSQALRAR